MKKSKTYLSTKFCTKKSHDPSMELEALESLLVGATEKENYKLARIIRKRISTVKQRIKNREVWYELKKIGYSLN